MKTFALVLVLTLGPGLHGHAHAEPPASTQAQPAKKDKPKIYDEAADARTQIAAALAKAKKENQRVLIQWGGNWCGWCTLLHECMTKDREIARTVSYEYVVVHIDAGRPKDKNLDLAKSYGADLQKHGFPYLTVLDGDGAVVANQDTGSLEVPNEMKHDRDKVLAFLKKHAAAPLDANAVYAAALDRARSQNKNVLVHFGAPWCGWCHRLEDWMAKPEVAQLLDRDFVEVKIDTDRMIGGADLLTKFRGSEKGGIPWFAFMDAAGKLIITSDGPKGNVGFPAAAEEIEHFQAMLAKAARTLTAEEQKRIIDSLRADKKPAAAAPTGG